MHQKSQSTIFVCLNNNIITLEEVLKNHRVGEVGTIVMSLGRFGVVDTPSGFVTLSEEDLHNKRRVGNVTAGNINLHLF